MLKYLSLKYIYLFVIIIWVPFQIFILGVDGAGVSLMLLTGLVFVNESLRFRFIQVLQQKPIIWWGAWVIYSFYNTIYKGSTHDSITIFFFSLFIPFLALCVTYLLYLKSKKILFNTVIGALTSYLALALIFDGHVLFVDRLDGKLNANLIGIYSFILVFFLLLKYVHKQINFLLCFSLSVLPFSVIILSASRKSFAALAILMIAFFLTKLKGSIIKKTVVLGFGYLIFYLSASYLLESTQIGERLAKTTEDTESHKALQTGTVLDYFGDRGVHYYYGWQLFSENPITGIGLKNFIKEAPLEYVLHSEYMVQLAEGGLFGSILFVLFYFWIGSQLFRLYKSKKELSNKILVYAGGFGGVLFINTAAWTYEFAPIFILFGAIVGFILSEKNNSFHFAEY
ncbi:O-antigen ligase family protein [Pontibacter pamirensis]|uniref:O-antigen ligase family protein n=1 Tax=Pontibacter pamirensis TaxID=2562824 RepID=UPI001389F186|nr:O-antigen ligase family protein [Pontibacter pamirensis]